MANSRVGVKINVLIFLPLLGEFVKFCRIGIAKDAVFPLPVLDLTIQSVPERILGTSRISFGLCAQSGRKAPLRALRAR